MAHNPKIKFEDRAAGLIVGLAIIISAFMVKSPMFLKIILWFIGIAITFASIYFFLPKSRSNVETAGKIVLLFAILLISVFILKQEHIFLSTTTLSIGIAQRVTCPSFIGSDGNLPAYCKLFYYGGNYGFASNLLGANVILPGASSICAYSFNGSMNGYLYGTNYCVLSEAQCPSGTSVVSYSSPGLITCTTAPSSSSSSISSSTPTPSSSSSSLASISASFKVTFIGIIDQVVNEVAPVNLPTGPCSYSSSPSCGYGI